MPLSGLALAAGSLNASLNWPLLAALIRSISIFCTMFIIGMYV